MSTRALFNVIEEAGTTNNYRVIQVLNGKKFSALNRMQDFDAQINPKTHHLEQTIYVMKPKFNKDDE